MESTAPTWESIARSIFLVGLAPLTVLVAMTYPQLLAGVLAGLLLRGSAQYGRQVLGIARRDIGIRLGAHDRSALEYRTQASRDK